jgi:hypothetical protein
MTGYDKKSVELSPDKQAQITIEIDIDGTGIWVKYKTFDVNASETLSHSFPEGLGFTNW